METLLPFEKMERSILVRKKAETSDKFGQDPNNRSIEELKKYAIINLDKCKGPTSHQVSAYVQKALGIKKSGHSGTLDPKVTGVLPVAIGRATRVVQMLLTSGKEYIVLMHMHSLQDETALRKAIMSFVGKMKQLPPIKSAVKRQWRYRKIYYIDILEIEDQDVLFKVGCQAGTYIRKLCHDIGLKLQTGAHMAELRRSKTGPFREETLVTLHDVSDAYHFWEKEGNEEYIRRVLLPIERAVDHIPKVWILDTTVDTISHGANLNAPGIAHVESDIQIDEDVAIMSLKNELVALGKAKMISKDMQTKERGLSVQTNKVFMLPETYPRIQRKE